MKDIAKMRLGVLREIKNIRIFFDNMERSIKTRNPEAVQKAYMFLVHLVYHMDKGCLTPMNIALDVEIGKALNELDEDNY
jgi:FtsP/CotA-like multicopper oxidase with cupredoxin domain